MYSSVLGTVAFGHALHMLLTENEDASQGVQSGGCCVGRGRRSDQKVRSVCNWKIKRTRLVTVPYTQYYFSRGRGAGVSIERGKRGKGEDLHCVIVWTVPHRVPTQGA
jgi:hypothetical protein